MKKQLQRTLAVGAMVAAGFGVSAAFSPAQAIDECNNEPADFNTPSIAGVSVGVDDPTTVEFGVVWVCARADAVDPLSPVVVGVGAEIRTAPLDIEPEYCVKVDHQPVVAGACNELPSPI